MGYNTHHIRTVDQIVPTAYRDDVECFADTRRLLAETFRYEPNRIPQISEFVAQLIEEGILFIVLRHGNFPTVEHLVRAFEAEGVPCFGLYLFSDAPSHIPFRTTLHSQGSLWVLAEVVARAASIPIYLQAHARFSFLSQVIHQVHPGAKIYQEVYDWMDHFVDPEHESVFVSEGVFTKTDIRRMRISERYILEHVNGVIHKDAGLIEKKLAGRPSAQIFPSPPRALMRAPKSRSLPSKIRLVHAGQLRSHKAPRRVFGDLHCASLYRRLITQNLSILLYPAFTKDKQVFREHYGDYEELAHALEDIILRSRIPLPELISTLQDEADFGILLYEFPTDLAAGQAHFQGTIASKLFTYWAAGLPVLVSEELETMASLVRDTGAGLVLKASELGQLGNRLRKLDYEALQDAVRRAQHLYAVENFLPKITALMRSD
ncbi:MAG: hypothetical protein AAF355_06790 [Myxococcota bacterium]